MEKFWGFKLSELYKKRFFVICIDDRNEMKSAQGEEAGTTSAQTD